ARAGGGVGLSGRGGKRVGVCRAACAGVGGYHSLAPQPNLGAGRASTATVPAAARAAAVSCAGREGARGKETMMTTQSAGPGAQVPDGAAGLDAILKPRSIAVIGASRSPDAIGHQILSNLVRHGFTGAVFPINPKADSVHSIRAYARIGEVPDAVDLAVIAVPAEQVVAVAKECAAAGVRGLVVISAGFREVGREGAEREAELVEVVRRHGMRLVGPNCLGVLNANAAVSMNATFAPVMPAPGRVAFLSQSGALGLSILDYASEYRVGVSQFVSVGNKPDVSGNDLLEYWEDDDSIGVILMYVE